MQKNNHDDYLQISKENFVNNILIPSNMGLVNHSVTFGIREIDGGILLCSNLWVQQINQHCKIKMKDHTDAIGKDLTYFIEAAGIKDSMRMLKNEQLCFSRLKNGKVCDLILNRDNCNYLITHSPISLPNGEIFAYRYIYRKIIIPLSEYFYMNKKRFNVTRVSLNNVCNIKLTEREQLVLFFLLLGLSQKEISVNLNCSRGLINKIIAEKLCPKFDIEGISSQLLIEKAIQAGFDSIIPKYLLFGNCAQVDLHSTMDKTCLDLMKLE